MSYVNNMLEFERTLDTLADTLDYAASDIRPHDKWLCGRVEALYRELEERLADLRLDMLERAT